MKKLILIFTLLFGSFNVHEVLASNPKKTSSYDDIKINFNNVPISEYINFVSEICNINFIFEKTDLNFNVTVISTENSSPSTVMETLIQLLRIHGFSLLEENNNLVIHKNANIKQIPKIISKKTALEEMPPIATRIFKIKNVQPSSIVNIIKPMISNEAIIEILKETNQIIITDISSTIKKIEELIEIIDTSPSPLKIETYKTIQNTPSYLIDLANKILKPLAGNDALILVPQEKTNIIFIISTPNLIEKTISILARLDTYEEDDLSKFSFFTYSPKNRKLKSLEKAIKDFAKNLEEAKIKDPILINTLNSVKVVASSQSLLFTGSKYSFDRVKEILTSIDMKEAPPLVSVGEKTFYIYKIKEASSEKILDSIKNIEESLKEEKVPEKNLILALDSAKYIPNTHSLLFTGNQSELIKIKNILDSLDTKVPPSKNFYIYKIKNTTPEKMLSSIKSIKENLKEAKIPEENLILALDSVKYIHDTNSLLFTGTNQSLNQTKELVSSFDEKDDLTFPDIHQFYMYKPKYKSLSNLENTIKDLGKTLETTKIKAPTLINALNNVKIINSSNSLLFTGDQTTINEIKDILASLDAQAPSSLLSVGENFFYIYKIKNVPSKKILNAIETIEKSLEDAKIPEKNLILALNSVKYIPDTNSLLFAGTPQSLNQIKELLPSFDAETTKEKLAALSSQFYMYKPKYQSLSNLATSLKEIADNLNAANLANPSLMNTIENLKIIDSTRSILFTGDENSLNRIKELILNLDTPQKTKPLHTYYLYKLKYSLGNVIEEDLYNFAEKLSTQKIQHPNLIKVLENAKWIKETNSIMLTGDSTAIDEAKIIIQQFDLPRKEAIISLNDNFLIYKPKFTSCSYIKKTLLDTAENFQKANLADKDLLNTIINVKIIESTNSLAFTGTQKSIEKIKHLLLEIDTEDVKKELIEPIGKTTYFLYKIKNAQPPQLIASIKSIVRDLKITKASDENFVNALDSLKYKSETHSLLFTGTPKALEKVKILVEKFDVKISDKMMLTPSSYFVYKPKYISGPSLENILQDFVEHLKNTGLDNKSLFSAVESMKWDPTTNSIVVSGNPTILDEVKQLLETFDTPKEKSIIEKDIIQPIDETSFLVYKLQYHKGDAIQTALKQISKELALTKASKSPSLLNAINSIQWIQITNSLLCSGNQDTMQKLKLLIKSLDIPLKQVFIEILVIETSFSNLLNFGLEWGGKFKFIDRFVGGSSNSPPSQKGALDPFMKNLDAVSDTNPILGKMFPFSSGFDLGIIGDVLMHKGRSFLSLGSFLKAIQSDEETSIVSTPKLIAQDNKTSTIFFGQNIPYVGSTTSIQGAASSEITNLEYRDIGLNLTLTPVLGNGDTVTLNIDLQRTVVAPDQINSQTLKGVQGIISSKTTMQTTVHIPNKNFLVLSGMITETKSKSKSGIPCLGGLPLIGAAFSNTARADDKKNIVIFIRPHIINSYEDMLNITQTQEDFFRENAGSATLEKEFDESMEFIKSYED